MMSDKERKERIANLKEQVDKRHQILDVLKQIEKILTPKEQHQFYTTNTLTNIYKDVNQKQTVDLSSLFKNKQIDKVNELLNSLNDYQFLLQAFENYRRMNFNSYNIRFLSELVDKKEINTAMILDGFPKDFLRISSKYSEAQGLLRRFAKDVDIISEDQDNIDLLKEIITYNQSKAINAISLDDYDYTKKQYDLILYPISVGQDYMSSIQNKDEVDHEGLMKSLSDDGVFILQLSSNRLKLMQRHHFFQELINKGHLKSVIKLNSARTYLIDTYRSRELVRGTNYIKEMNDLVFIFTKQKNTHVLMIDGNDKENYIENTQLFQERFSNVEMKRIFKALYKETKYSKYVSVQQIIEENYNVVPSFYLDEYDKLLDDGVELGRIASIFRGKERVMQRRNYKDSEDNEPVGYQLNISEVSDGYIIEDIESTIDEETYEKNLANRYILEENDIVLTARGTSLKIAMITKEDADKNILPSANLNVIRITNKEYNPYYIYAYLKSNLGQYHLDHMQMGGRMSIYSNRDLEHMLIVKLDEKTRNEIATETMYLLNELKEVTKKQAKLKKQIQHTFDANALDQKSNEEWVMNEN